MFWSRGLLGVLILAACSQAARPRSLASSSSAPPRPHEGPACSGTPCSGAAEASAQRNDTPRSQKELSEACHRKDVRACQQLGNALAHRENRSQEDLSEAFRYYQLACEGGLPDGCANVGAMYEEGWGVPVNIQKAREYYEATCNERTQLSCSDLGFLYEFGKGVPTDYAMALRFYEMACNASESDCNALGCLYRAGHGVERDPKRAASLYTRACNAGVGQACQNLAEVQMSSPSPDLANAERSSRQGCELQYAPACRYNRLVRAVQSLTEPPESPASALAHCRGGKSTRCFELGLRFAIGFGVAHDGVRAAQLFEKACQEQVPEACEFSGSSK
ncbi:MAG: tetratricopeptide repeat protein [Myxococcota bacterium]